jgi:septum formation protein
MEPIILASRSPRRFELLQHLGVTFEVDADDVDEAVEPGQSPAEIVVELAKRKADPVSARHPDRLVLAADTIVVLEDQILGKPASPDEAVVMLSALSGVWHEVLTGVALAHKATGRLIADYRTTQVNFDQLSEAEIEQYVDGGSPLDKAGAYGIQDDRGALFIKSIVGDYYNVVGLPINLVYRLVRQHFPDLSPF